MSRCFPFPPPGYEKKARADDIDLLKKEKSKEKKLKKEKKDKEKRESKEKRHKDRSDEEKRKEKKEKKEKSRDKRKDRDENKTGTSDEQRLLGKTDNHNGGNLLHKEHINTFLKKPDTGQSAGYTGAKFIQNNHLAEQTKRSELLPNSGKSIKDKEMEKFAAAQSKRDDRMVRLVATASSTSMEVLDNIKDHKMDDRKIGVLGIREEARFSTNAMVQNPAGAVRNQTGAEVVSKPSLEKKDSKPSDKKVDGRKETKDKIREGGGSEKRKEKHKDKDREKKVKSKDKEKEKEKKKEEKAKEKVEDRRGEMNKSKESNEEKIIGSLATTASQLHEDGGKSANLEGNFRKRKDFETNGFLHTDDIRPIKFQKLSSSSHPITVNGKILEPCQTALDRQGTSNTLKLDSKERKINGVIEAQPSASSVKPTATRQGDQMAPPPPKPPHPDCRYLSQIYAVPKVEEGSYFGDQQWLFNSSDSPERKPKYSVVEEVPQVWAEAFPIESADIYALPYVIPY